MRAAPTLTSDDGAPAGRTRLLREAQALARLAHPNVVSIHDVGTVGERVWLAMELVEGRTLARWSAEAPRRWPEVLAMMIAAGRGLASAHAAGLIHRDFKPENVMVAHDGRVLVMDFGLARSREDADAPPGGAAPSGGLLDSELTRAGALVGTPAYMAPEQLAGGDVGPLTDSPTV